MVGTLYTSYFAKIKKGIGIKLSIARYNPKWLKIGDIDETLIGLAPSKELLNDYKYKGISWAEYTERYKSQIHKEQMIHDDIFKFSLDIGTIRELLNEGRHVTVYCYEKPSDNCHRHILGDILKEMGYEVKEIV